MRIGPLIALPDERPDGRWRSVQNADPVFFDQAPPAIRLGEIGRAFVNYAGRSSGEWTVNDVAVPRDPANIRRAPEGVFFFQVKDPLHRHVDLKQVPRRGVDNAFGFARGSGC